jgi:hypothetical protein
MSDTITIDIGTLVAIIVLAGGLVGVYLKIKMDMVEIRTKLQGVHSDLTFIKERLMQNGLCNIVSTGGITMNSPIFPSEELAQVEFTQDTLDKIKKKADKLDYVYDGFKNMTDKGVMAHLTLAIEEMIVNKEIAPEDIEKVKRVLKGIGYDRLERLETVDTEVLALCIAAVVKEKFHLSNHT